MARFVMAYGQFLGVNKIRMSHVSEEGIVY
jgi:hypothetical protein